MVDKLTIAIPVFERFDFFEEALLSVINQTIKCDIIVVDNASSHNKFEEKCNKMGIRYYKNDFNIGMFANWNLCFEYSDTDFVMILGDDDILELDYVEKFKFYLEEYNDIDVYYTDFKFLYSNEGDKERKEKLWHMPFGYQKNGQKIIEYAALYGLFFPTISCIIKKAKFTGFYTGLHASNDWLWIYSNALELTFYGLNEKKCYYRKHIKSDTNNLTVYSLCLLSHAYIYERVISSKVNTKELNNILRKQINKSLFLFYIYSKKKIYPFDEENIYSLYLKSKIRDSYFVKIINLCPYKLLRLLQIIKNKLLK